MAAFLGGLARRAPGRFGRLRRLFGRDKTQSQRRSGLAADPNGAVELLACRCFLKFSEQIDRRAIGAESTRMPPAGPHDNVSAALKQRRDPVRLHVSAIA